MFVGMHEYIHWRSMRLSTSTFAKYSFKCTDLRIPNEERIIRYKFAVLAE